MLIRNATTDDAAAIAAIGRVEFPRLHDPLMGAVATRAIIDQIYTEAALVESITRCTTAEGAHFIVAERDGRVVGYLHFDSFGSEPELHRIYLAHEEIGRGTGSHLMDELHDRLGPTATYILLVAEANESARRFYERHDLLEERHVADCNALYGDNMGVQFPPEAQRVPALVMRWRGRRPGPNPG